MKREVSLGEAKNLDTQNISSSNRFNKYFWLNIPNLLARQSGKIAQVGFKVLLYSFTMILNLLLYGTIYRGLSFFN